MGKRLIFLLFMWLIPTAAYCADWGQGCLNPWDCKPNGEQVLYEIAPVVSGGSADRVLIILTIIMVLELAGSVLVVFFLAKSMNKTVERMEKYVKQLEGQ